MRFLKLETDYVNFDLVTEVIVLDGKTVSVLFAAPDGDAQSVFRDNDARCIIEFMDSNSTWL